jgi:hypothetical protein
MTSGRPIGTQERGMMDKLQELLVWCGELRSRQAAEYIAAIRRAWDDESKQELRDERRGINIALDMVCDKMKELMQ